MDTAVTAWFAGVGADTCLHETELPLSELIDRLCLRRKGQNVERETLLEACWIQTPCSNTTLEGCHLARPSRRQLCPLFLAIAWGLHVVRDGKWIANLDNFA
jgi:hypothetical protein